MPTGISGLYKNTKGAKIARGEKIKQTNFDRIKAMSVKEMAEAYVELIMQQTRVSDKLEHTNATAIDMVKRNLFIQTVRWLESEVAENV